MTCEWAEGYLSAYLDDALDPQLRKDVGAHIEQCVRCQALAEEYRRNDQLLTTMAPVEPSDQLRQRIFESPAFAALARELERETADSPPGRVASRRAPLYLRALVPLAALLTISLGAALLFRQGLLPFGGQTARQQQTNTIGNPGSFDLPLSAGPRLVFLNGGALWSVAEYAPNSTAGAPGTPQRLTAAEAHVSAWRVSPLTATTNGGARIAYVDSLTGALHIVHSDGQADTIVGAVSPTQSPSASFWTSAVGRAALASLTWSPDGAHLAYIAATPDGGAQTRIVTLSSGASAALAPAFDAPITQLTWSADSHALAGATVSGGVASVIVWHSLGHAAMTLPANPSDTRDSAAQIAWSGASLTWASSHDGAIVGVYLLPAKSATVTRLTATDASYSAAAFTAAHGGEWLLAGGGTLSEARLAGGGVMQVATLGTAASAIVWSPNGASAAISLSDRLALWRDGAGLTTLAQGATSLPTWSPDNSALAVAEGQSVRVYRIGADIATQVERLTNSGSMLALAWAADARNIAIAESQGMLLAPSDGAGATLLTSRQADGGMLSWSVAR